MTETLAARPTGARPFRKSLPDWLLPFLRQRRAVLGLLFALGLVAAGTALVPPYLTKLVIDEGLIAGDAGALLLWTGALFLAGLASLGLGALSSVLHMRASVAMLADLRAALVRGILARPASWRAEERAGELLARIDGDAGEAQRFAFTALLSGTGAVLRLIGGAAMLFVLHWKLALLAVALMPLELAFLAWARPRTEALARGVREARGGLSAGLSEMLAGIGGIQAARAEAPIAGRIATRQAALSGALNRAQVFGEVTRAIPALLTALMRAAVFLAGGLMVIRGDWPLGSLIAFLAYLGFLTGPAQSLLGLWHAEARVRASIERLAPILGAAPGARWPAEPVPLPPGGGRLTLSGVTVTVAGRRLIAGLSAEIPAGARVHLAGPSGIGKSSLIACLHRQSDPASGSIALDGVPLGQLSRETLRAAITLVPQRPFVIAGSVAENLLLGKPDASEAEMVRVLGLVALDGRLSPASRLGEDGLTLSGGERQRLCLARALLAPGRVLVLDEALSEVDPGTAAAILGRIAGPTLILTSHAVPPTRIDATISLSPA